MVGVFKHPLNPSIVGVGPPAALNALTTLTI
jgi:hypothetical protein